MLSQCGTIHAPMAVMYVEFRGSVYRAANFTGIIGLFLASCLEAEDFRGETSQLALVRAVSILTHIYRVIRVLPAELGRIYSTIASFLQNSDLKTLVGNRALHSRPNISRIGRSRHLDELRCVSIFGADNFDFECSTCLTSILSDDYYSVGHDGILSQLIASLCGVKKPQNMGEMLCGYQATRDTLTNGLRHGIVQVYDRCKAILYLREVRTPPFPSPSEILLSRPSHYPRSWRNFKTRSAPLARWIFLFSPQYTTCCLRHLVTTSHPQIGNLEIERGMNFSSSLY